MKNFNIVKLDSKGRILIPYHIRNQLELEDDVELMITNNGNRELKVFPLLKGSTAEILVSMADTPGSLAKILSVINKQNIDVMMSISKTIERGELAEWNAIVSTSSCKDIKKAEKAINSLNVVKDVRIVVK